ncbi:winged helix-turn-helix transcriptional regulator [Natronococcus sp. JC468]|uniref:winged helix-turn-helix domain-containing protein n=1 Tax=Natronococcus sp. JC468 TaxID=1961921 RepID=UPI00143AA385|nr:winged helix-turn-helix domain-containing protein [Natronococcus sp. JC468]NKE37917.1 winged helix-turn-helix transcriptional regulator [Natronococcus sp. JC468]
MSTIENDPDLENSDAYAEGTVLPKLLGNDPKVMILASFLADPDPDFDYTVTEIAELAGVSRNTVYRHIDDLCEIGVIKKTRESGGSPRYKFDKENPAAKRLAQLEWDLMRHLYADD